VNQLVKHLGLKPLVQYGAILFIACVSFAYMLQPHWLTFSHFAAQWYTLIPFVIAMMTCAFLLWGIGWELRQHNELYIGGNALRASAIGAILIVCIPYTGSMAQKNLHNSITLLFVLLAAFGIAWSGKQLRNYTLGAMSGALLGICILELIFLARFDTHPVRSWVWVVLQLAATLLLILGLYIIAEKLEQESRQGNP
jgi:hypothetical protein